MYSTKRVGECENFSIHYFFPKFKLFFTFIFNLVAFNDNKHILNPLPPPPPPFPSKTYLSCASAKLERVLPVKRRFGALSPTPARSRHNVYRSPLNI